MRVLCQKIHMELLAMFISLPSISLIIPFCGKMVVLNRTMTGEKIKPKLTAYLKWRGPGCWQKPEPGII